MGQVFPTKDKIREIVQSLSDKDKSMIECLVCDLHDTPGCVQSGGTGIIHPCSHMESSLSSSASKDHK